jgi:hypothetical protein
MRRVLNWFAYLSRDFIETFYTNPSVVPFPATPRPPGTFSNELKAPSAIRAALPERLFKRR